MRLTPIALVLLALVACSAPPSFAQAAATPQQPAAAPAQAAAPAKPAVEFKNDAGLFIFYIKPDKTADFEDLMTKLKDGLAKNDAPEAKQMAAGLKLFKTPVAAGAQVASYILIADPVVKNTEYWLLTLLYKAYPIPAESKALYDKWLDVKAANPAQPTILDLTLVTKMQ